MLVSCFPNISGCLDNGILQSNRRTIMDDLFIRNYIEDLLKNIRTQVLLKLIKPYTRIRIPFISKVAIYFIVHVNILSFWTNENMKSRYILLGDSLSQMCACTCLQ